MSDFRKSKVRLIKQNNESDCAVACIRMIADYLGVSIPAATIRKLSKTNYAGTSVYGVVQCLNSIGITSTPLKGSIDELLLAVFSSEITLPFICLLNKPNGLDHFVVVECVSKKITIYDPAERKYNVEIDDFVKVWSGCIITIDYINNHDKKSKKKAKNLLLGIIAKEWKLVITVFIISFLLAVIGVAMSFSLQLIIEGASADADGNKIIQVSILLFAISIVQMIMSWLRGVLVIKIKLNISVNMTKAFLSSLFDLDYDYYMSFLSGDYVQRFDSLQQIPEIIAQITASILLDCITFVLSITALFVLSKELTLMVLALLMIVVFGIVLSDNKVHKANKLLAEANAEMDSTVVEFLRGMESIKANKLKNWIISKTTQKYDNSIQREYCADMITLRETTFLGGTITVGIIAVLMTSGIMINRGNLSVGSMLSFYTITAFLFEPIEKLMNMHAVIEKTAIAIRRLQDVIYGAKDESEYNSIDSLRSKEKLGISMENISFSYDYKADVLSNISFVIEPGECVGIIGKSGCGKSTIGRIVSGLLQPDEGKVQYYNLTQIYSGSEVKSKLGLVSQHDSFFEGSIIDNLIGNSTDVSQEEVKDICRMVGVHSDIESMPDKYETLLFSNASNISTGQRQRLALARAVVSRPQLIVLDEITCNLDQSSRNLIIKAISEIKKSMTCVIITHDQNMMGICDRCINIQYLNEEK